MAGEPGIGEVLLVGPLDQAPSPFSKAVRGRESTEDAAAR